MPVLQADDIADLILITLKDLGRLKFTLLAANLQEYVALPNLLRKERVGFGSGFGVQFNVMKKDSGAAENTGLFAADNVNVGDVFAQATVPWRHTNTKFAFDRREISMNRSPARIVDLAKGRRVDGMVSLAKKMETNFWNDPPSDGETPFGVPYWMPRNTSQGFNGGNPTNFSAGAGGLAVADVPNSAWDSYSDQYVSITTTDLLRKWRRAATKTGFMAPVKVPDYNTGNRYGYYCNYDVLGELEELAVAQNDQLGRDLASTDGRTMFRQNPITYVPHLDSDAPQASEDPVYGINWGVFKIVFLRGEWLRETGPQQHGLQHNTLQVFIDLSYNFVCYDRRRCFNLSK